MRRIDLARSVLLTASGITRLLDGLEGCGLVAKERCDPTRASPTPLLTKAGVKKIEEARESHLVDIEELFGSKLLAGGAGAARRAPRASAARAHRRRRPSEARVLLPRRARRRARLPQDPRRRSASTAFGVNAIVIRRARGLPPLPRHRRTSSTSCTRAASKVDVDGESRELGEGGLFHGSATTPRQHLECGQTRTRSSSSSAARAATSSATAIS